LPWIQMRLTTLQRWSTLSRHGT